MSDSPSPFVAALAGIAQDAAKLVMAHFGKTTQVRRKSDASPVTAADEAAEALILKRLHALAPDVPVIAEEQMAKQAAQAPGPRFFLVDPLDGTSDFIRGGDEFTVNIALIDDGEAVCGALVAPARLRAFLGEKDKGAWEIPAENRAPRPIRARPRPAEGMTVLVSRNHPTGEAELYAGETVARLLPMSSSLKFAVLAAGEADLYPRIGPTMEWDTAAGQAILEAAGGRMLSASGDVFGYGKPGFRNGGFIARGLG
jgi:3'(2'), 5'-bisphosphate nucleotidase